MPQTFTKSQKIIFLVIGIIVFLFILMILGILPGLKSTSKKSASQLPKITLEFWGFDDEEAFKSAIDSYTASYPNVSINYHQINQDNYENQLIDSLASQKGPDILMIKHNWVYKHGNKLYPTDISLRDLKLSFVDVVADDLYVNNKLWGLPLWVDTLALYYNKDLFNSAGIVQPPQTWDEFLKDAQLLTKKNQSGEIIQSGAAFGAVKNITNAVDIILLLMMQNNQEIVDKNGRGAFDTDKGSDALNFYLSFSNPASPNYCWGNSLADALELFGQGKVAMMIDYSSAIKKIEQLNPYLNYAIAFLPQVKDSTIKKNYADYWALAVSAISKHPKDAWNFIHFLVDNQNNSLINYLNYTSRPTANRVFIQTCKTDEKLGVFCEQALTAKTWLQLNPEKNYQILKNMLESIISGQSSVSTALNQAAQLINQ